MAGVRPLLGIGVSVGVLAGLWTYVSVELALITWVAFVAWACFFAAGGGRTGLARGLAANVSGVLWGWVAVQSLDLLPAGTLTLAVVVTVLGFVLCVQAAAAPLAFIPGAFAGTAIYFGTAFDLSGTLVAVVCGGLLGLVSELLGARLQSLVDRSGATGPAPAPTTVPTA